jgi:hypothetical protein
MSTEVGERPHVAALLALVGPLTVQVRSTVPVKELAGVTEMVDVLPEVAPELMERLLGLPESEKLVPVVGASQKPLHPARNGRTARKSPAQLACLMLACLLLARIIAARIPSPEGLDRGPDSLMPIGGADSCWQFVLRI